MKEDMKKQGAFSWFELMTPDVEAARKFYAELVGWETEDMTMEGMRYIVLKVGKEEVGGMMPFPPQAEGVPPHWGIYVTVDDVDEIAKRAEKLGGKIIVPLTDVTGVGKFFTMQDPQGAVISFITYVER